MAISRGAGTEIIRAHCHEAVNSTTRDLIIGVQYHIYTVLSIICQAQAVATAGNWTKCWLVCYDIVGGTTGRSCNIFQQDLVQYQTFVWNDKFSFNGTEPTDFTATLDVTKQDAVADQAQNTAQKLQIASEAAGDNIDIITTFLDQNNA